MSIVVTAASGHLGRLVVQDLLRRGIAPDRVVAGARSLPAVEDLADAGMRTVVLDYDQPDTVEAAVSAGDALVLISGATSPTVTGSTPTSSPPPGAPAPVTWSTPAACGW